MAWFDQDLAVVRCKLVQREAEEGAVAAEVVAELGRKSAQEGHRTFLEGRLAVFASAEDLEMARDLHCLDEVEVEDVHAIPALANRALTEASS